ncbi:MAG: energy-converting hydrogenase B subunit EhbP [Candidatus Altiarchaeota archaeon]
MTKIIVESGLVFNLGGYVIESRISDMDFIDVVVGNPLGEDVKIDAPMLSRRMIDDLADKGLLVEYVRDGDSLKDKLDGMKARVGERLGD